MYNFHPILYTNTKYSRIQHVTLFYNIQYTTS